MSLEINKQITDNCIITHIEENNVQGNILVAAVIHILFFGKECEAYVAVERLKDDDPRYAMIESSSEIHSSLTDILETEEAWEAVRESVQEYVKYLKQYDDV